MFIDYLTLIMVNLIAGTALLAYYLWKGADEKDQKPYAAPFLAVGLLSLVLGVQLSTNWPLPGAYNIAFGESTALFGVVFLAAGLAFSQGWDLGPTSVVAFFAGVYAVLAGARILNLGMTKEPIISAVGFILAGLGGIFSPVYFMYFRNNKSFRYLAILVLLATVAIWAVTFYGALWGHLEGFGKWLPATMPATK